MAGLTDGLPALALVMDPPLPGVLERPPRPSAEPMLGRSQWTRILLVGALEAAIVLTVFLSKLGGGDVALARSFAFSTLVFCELFRAFAARSRNLVYWQVGAFTNVHLIAVVALSALVQISLGHMAFARSFFRILAMSGPDTALCLALGLIPVSVLELGKLLRGAGRAVGAAEAPPSFGR